MGMVSSEYRVSSTRTDVSTCENAKVSILHMGAWFYQVLSICAPFVYHLYFYLRCMCAPVNASCAPFVPMQLYLCPIFAPLPPQHFSLCPICALHVPQRTSEQKNALKTPSSRGGQPEIPGAV